MIRFNIIGFNKSDKGAPRWGDCTIIDDGMNHLVIDGYCGIGTTRLISRLKKLKVKDPVLFISHAHYDHYYGIRKIINDTYFEPAALYMYDPHTLNASASSDVKSEINTMKKIMQEANDREIPVNFLKDGDRVEYGDIKFDVYRDQPAYKGNSDAYINDGSLCFWFPDQLYLTTGDAGLDCAQKHNLKPIFIKIGHHGNDCPRAMSTWLYKNGCRYCWDNDVSGNYTEFLMTGREDCIGVGMKYFSCIGDLNFIAYAGKMVIYKDFKTSEYKIPYKGAGTLKSANLAAVKNVLKNVYGGGNTRITNLMDAGYYPVSVQNQVNEIIRLVKGLQA